MNGNIFQYLQDKKGKPLPFEYKLLYNIPLTQDELIYNGNLILYDSKITSLPNNLIVNGYLDIGETNIFELPDDLYVQCDLWCENTPLAYKIEKNESLLTKYSKQIKGGIYYGKYFSILRKN